jgi:hypothetical protein
MALDVPVVATIAAKGRGLIASVKQHPRAERIEVTTGSRDALPGELAVRLKALVTDRP